MFDLYDADHNGVIEVSELISVAAAWGITLDPQVSDLLITSFRQTRPMLFDLNPLSRGRSPSDTLYITKTYGPAPVLMFRYMLLPSFNLTSPPSEFEALMNYFLDLKKSFDTNDINNDQKMNKYIIDQPSHCSWVQVGAVSPIGEL